jgi:hypothetical protein
MLIISTAHRFSCTVLRHVYAGRTLQVDVYLFRRPLKSNLYVAFGPTNYFVINFFLYLWFCAVFIYVGGITFVLGRSLFFN